jgi:hypothetical protein
MTIYDFHLLDEMEQAEAVWSGVHIGEREDEEHKISLYQIEAFYVEVFYHKEYEVTRKMRAFVSTTLLEPYLDKISLPQSLIG